jgi:hypothetical protein
MKTEDWISVKTTLPEMNVSVLVWIDGGFWRILKRRQDTDKWRWYTDDEEMMYLQDWITHWMPLPKPPKN